MKKVAVIGAKGLPPKQGGIEHYCAEVYPRMAAQGHSIDVFARASYTELPWFYRYNHQGVQVIDLCADQEQLLLNRIHRWPLEIYFDHHLSD